MQINKILIREGQKKKKSAIKRPLGIFFKDKDVKIRSENFQDTNVLALKNDQVYSPQSKKLGDVEIEVTPVEVSIEKTVFNLSFNTHSVDLSYDFTQTIPLYDDKGNDYKALDWEGGQGGHNLIGKLNFSPLKEGANSFILRVEEIENVSSDFVWKI